MRTRNLSRLGKVLAILFTLVISLGSLSAQGTILPGDANNSGRVTNIDVLYWALNRGNTGPPRSGGSDCVETFFTDPWGPTVPGEADRKYSDADGDGLVESDPASPDGDLVVIQANLGCEKADPDDISPDPSGIGDPGSDPVLELTTTSTEVMADDIIDIDVSLGTEALPLNNIFAVAFTLSYDTALVVSDPAGVTFTLEADNWLNQGNPDDALVFVENEPDSGRVQVTIFRTNADNTTASGSGKVGQISIAIESIILDTDPDIFTVGVLNVLAIDSTLTRTNVGPLPFEIPVVLVSSVGATQTDGQDIELFPNPTGGQFTIRQTGPVENWRSVELLKANGQWIRLPVNDPGARSFTIDLKDFPAGIYPVRIMTDTRQIVRRVVLYQ